MLFSADRRHAPHRALTSQAGKLPVPISAETAGEPAAPRPKLSQSASYERQRLEAEVDQHDHDNAHPYIPHMAVPVWHIQRRLLNS